MCMNEQINQLCNLHFTNGHHSCRNIAFICFKVISSAPMTTSYSPEDETHITAILSADIITRGIPTKTQEAPRENCLGMLNINTDDEIFTVRLCSNNRNLFVYRACTSRHIAITQAQNCEYEKRTVYDKFRSFLRRRSET